MSKTQEKWKEDFIDEFGIHFSPSELQFVLEFIEEVISADRQSLVEEIEKRKVNPWTYIGELYKEGYENALSDIIALIKNI